MHQRFFSSDRDLISFDIVFAHFNGNRTHFADGKDDEQEQEQSKV